MIDYTTTQLIKDLKRRGSVPTNQALYLDADFCDVMNDASEMRVIPNVMRTREEFFVAEQLITIAADQTRFAIPERALASRLRQVSVLNADGENLRHVQRVEPEIGERGVCTTRGLHGTGLVSYYLENNEIVTTGDLSKIGPTLRIRYYRRPNRLVPVIQVARITGIAGDVYTVDNVPAGMTTGTVVDVICGKPHFNSLADSVGVSTTAGFDITVVGLTGVSIGDYICFEGETPIPQLPRELHQILIQYALVKVLSSLGDVQGADDAAKDLAALEANIYEYLDDRDDGSQRKVIQINGLWNSARDYFDW